MSSHVYLQEKGKGRSRTEETHEDGAEGDAASGAGGAVGSPAASQHPLLTRLLTSSFRAGEPCLLLEAPSGALGFSSPRS